MTKEYILDKLSGEYVLVAQTLASNYTIRYGRFRGCEETSNTFHAIQ